MAARKLTKERRLANCQRRASYCFGSQTTPNKIVADRLTCVYLKELASLVQVGLQKLTASFKNGAKESYSIKGS